MRTNQETVTATRRVKWKKKRGFSTGGEREMNNRTDPGPSRNFNYTRREKNAGPVPREQKTPLPFSKKKEEGRERGR